MGRSESRSTTLIMTTLCRIRTHETEIKISFVRILSQLDREWGTAILRACLTDR